MAVVETLDGLEGRIESAMREAEKAFGNGELIVERYLPQVRHLEVQVAGDGQGHAIHLFERECTLQRRHQKVIEEAPSSGLSPQLRAALLADAVKLAAGVNYRGLGTVEFVVTGEEHYFLEVNPRLQVEHPVTEEVTGLDLVELQLRIADTGTLPLTQADVRCSGHAFEARLCAEDAAAGFLPATGRLQVVDFSRAGVRIESGVDSGDEISPHYDSMIAKLIAHASDRDAARRALVAGLHESTVIGLVTNLEFLQDLLEWPETRDATFHTRLIDERHAQRGVVAPVAPALEHLAAAALHWLAQQRAGSPALGCWTLWDNFTGWRLTSGPVRAAPQPTLVLKAGATEWPVRFSRRDAHGACTLAIGEQEVNATLQPLAAGRSLLQCGGRALELTIRGDAQQVELASALGSSVFAAPPAGNWAHR
jgi:3-methylcrotonyl-CoA carboxylase alpha subunit